MFVESYARSMQLANITHNSVCFQESAGCSDLVSAQLGFQLCSLPAPLWFSGWFWYVTVPTLKHKVGTDKSQSMEMMPLYFYIGFVPIVYICRHLETVKMVLRVFAIYFSWNVFKLDLGLSLYTVVVMSKVQHLYLSWRTAWLIIFLPNLFVHYRV